MSDILLINGPNLNLLGSREPDRYGSESLEAITSRLCAEAERAGISISCVQSNAEHELIDAIHSAPSGSTQFIIINPAALTHTSIALRDALLAVAIPFIEVHISNPHAREAFRQHSYLSDIAEGVICGLGSFGYDCALAGELKKLTPNFKPA
jgi:3-dehydroquinate dehydratase-2